MKNILDHKNSLNKSERLKQDKSMFSDQSEGKLEIMNTQICGKWPNTQDLYSPLKLWIK